MVGVAGEQKAKSGVATQVRPAWLGYISVRMRFSETQFKMRNRRDASVRARKGGYLQHYPRNCQCPKDQHQRDRNCVPSVRALETNHGEVHLQQVLVVVIGARTIKHLQQGLAG